MLCGANRHRCAGFEAYFLCGGGALLFFLFQGEKREPVLTDDQGAEAIAAGEVSFLTDVEVTLDTAGKYCQDMAYLCVEVWRGDSAQPYYNIESPAQPADLRTCQPTVCNGKEQRPLLFMPA